jgi:phospholipid/cholesterol/gamma-HCH transport system substrate-binding protein
MMDERREQAWVGLFVLVAAALLLVTVFSLSGLFTRSEPTFHAKFPFAGGLEPGAEVRYAGGPKTGRVTAVGIDPNDPALIDVTFSVSRDVPVKTDSHVKIGSLSPLGDNHMEIVPGSAAAPLAPPGSTLTADPYVDFSALTAKLNDLAPDVQRLLAALNDRVGELKVTIGRVNDLLNDQNRENLAATLTQARGLLTDNRAQVKAAVANVNAASVKIGPLLDNLKTTSDSANKTINHVDSVIGQNEPAIRDALQQLRIALAKLNQVADQLNRTLDVNSDNIDQTLDNIRQITDNLNQFSETIKTRPSSIINSGSPRDRKPGDPK